MTNTEITTKANGVYRPGVGMAIIDRSSVASEGGDGVSSSENRGASVLVARRIDNPGPYWQMPQGGIDEGESVEAAAWRELYEELGLTPEYLELTGRMPDTIKYTIPEEPARSLWRGRYVGQEQHWLIFLTLKPLKVRLDNGVKPEFLSWKWLPVSELPRIAVPFKVDLYRRLSKAIPGYFPVTDARR